MQSNSTYRIFEDKTDQLFHDGLKGQPFGFTEADWQQLSRRLDEHDQRQKRKPPAKWQTLLLLLLLGGGAFFAATQLGGNKRQTEMASVQNGSQTATAPNENAVPAANEAGNSTQQNTLHNNTAQKNIPVTATSPAVSAVPNATTATTANNGVDAAQAAPARSHAPVVHIPQPAKILMPAQQTYGSNNNYNKNRRFKQRSDKKTQPAKALLPQTGDEINTETAIADEDEKEMTATANTAPEPITKTNDTPAPADNAAITTPQPDAAAALTSGNIPPVTKNKKEKKTRAPKEAPAHEFNNEGTWLVSAFTGYNRSTKDAQSFAAFLAPAGYTEKRLKQEQSLGSLQAGVRFDYRKKHLLLSSGLTYFEQGDQVRYDAAYSGNVALGANGRSTFSYLEIPITAGYEWANKHWGFSVQGGLSAAFLLNAKGKYVNTSNFTSQLFNLADNKQIFRNKIFSVLVTPAVHYYVNDRTGLFISPAYRLNLQPVTKTGAELSQKYSSLGFSIGVRMRLR
jgi:hypothetical protein